MFSLSVPSKTFLIGEYGALSGGPALLLSTPPRFILRASLCLGAPCQRIGLESVGPSSVLLREKVFSDYDLQFVDPHNGRGGLGASSARFVLLHAFKNWLKFQPTRADRLLAAYREAMKSLNEVMPSGYDVVSQFQGGLSFINWKLGQSEVIDWKLADLDVFLVRGPLKIATHTHLKQIDLRDTSELEDISMKAVNALNFSKADEFVKYLNEFSKALQMQGLSAPESLELQAALKKNPSVLAVKGCGAMGADVIAAVIPLKEAAKFKASLKEMKLELISRLSERAEGLKVDEMTHGELQSTFESEIAYYREESSHREMGR